MKYGVFSVSIPEYDVEQSVKVLSELGYDGIEWRVNNPPPSQKPDNYSFESRYWSFCHSTLDINNIERDAVKAKELCDQHGLDLISLTTYLRPHQVHEIEKVLKTAGRIGCRNIRVFPPDYNETEYYPDLFARALKELDLLDDMAAKYGVRINLEIHMGNIIPSASAAYRLVSNFDPRHIGVIYDVGNMVHEGFENYKLGLELLGDYIAYIHIKNAVLKKVGTSSADAEVWKPVWAPVKKGYADLEKLIRNLKEVGYNGYLSIEDFSNESDTYKKLKDNLQFLKQIDENTGGSL